MKRPRAYKSEVHERRMSMQDPLAAARNRKKLILAAKIAEALDRRDLKKGRLAELLDKNKSEISKWTSGFHNFTVDTLSDIEEALQINLLNTGVIMDKNIPQIACTLTVEVKAIDIVDPMDRNKLLKNAELFVATAGGLQVSTIEF